ncbi:MAG: hypothetical protein F2534_18490 [Actinobacteria bacterium]|nr:hypothetical protein [Actinomycetota bacterium]
MADQTRHTPAVPLRSQKSKEFPSPEMAAMSDTPLIKKHAAFIWSVADLLRGRINATTKTPPVALYNTHPAHRSRFVKP